ncbi:putative lipase [Sphingomonas sanguinis]|uniref:putative lipase n=1 Tax=Sphingomonas sanguinis TaxID=33051 RepID=UPI001C582845|nr:putative lipase [Sphingomonas sanguinis]QXT35816.1 putative lipase [Sphingomonas sanguinis]
MQGTWLREPTAGRAIIFVHGLWSNNHSAWSSADTSWPELVFADPQLDGYGIYLFDYQTTTSSRLYGAGDAAKSLTALMRSDGLVDLSEIVFVCHSQGGIVVRHHLVREQREYERQRTRVGLLLVASPSLGSHYASLGAFLFHHVQLRGLRFSQDNKWLNELDADFIDMKEKDLFPLFGKELVEEHPMFLRGLLSGWQIVAPHSAAKYFAKSRIIANTDHGSIAKPTSLESEQQRELVLLAQSTSLPSDADFVEAQQAASMQLRRIFVDPAAARSIAGPSPALLAAAPPVARLSLREAGETWWNGDQQVLVQLGSEGMGKTWGALDLLRVLSARSNGPLPVILTAQHAAGSKDGLEAVLSALSDVGEHAGLRGGGTRKIWLERLARWATAAPELRLRLLILVDGLDEVDPFRWDTWIAPLLTEQWSGLFRLVLTCREDDWRHRVGLDEVLPVGTEQGSVTRFSTDERDEYLRSRHVDLAAVSEHVLEAALHPRTAFHLTRLAAELGDMTRITREQLLLRDFQNRQVVKGGLLTPDGFKALVITQAAAAQAAALAQQSYRVTPGALVDAAADISGYDRGQMRTVLSDLISGDWLQRDPTSAHLLVLSDSSLPDAVGFALADLVRGSGPEAALPEIDRFLEPWGADDLVEKVLRTCATALIVDPSNGDDLCEAVMERWERSPAHGSAGQDFWRRLHVFRPELFLDYCARHARGAFNWLLPWAIACLWEDHPSLRPRVERKVGEWLSVVPLPEDHESDQPGYDALVNRDRRTQRERLADLELSEPGRWTSRIGQPAGTWPAAAARTAAQVIGFLPRLAFVPAFADWAENHAAAGHVSHDWEIATLLRHNDLDHEATLNAVRAEADRLSSIHGHGSIAAAHLLRATGEPEDAERAETLDPKRGRVGRSWVERMPRTDVLRLTSTLPRPGMVIDVLADFAADPTITLDPSLAEALRVHVEGLSSTDLPGLFDHGGAKLAVVLRWQPETLVALYRKFLSNPVAMPASHGASQHERAEDAYADADFRRHALGALPFLSPDECAALAELVDGRAAPDGAGRDAANALRLAHRPLFEQIALLEGTPSSSWPRDYRYLLNEPVGSEAVDLVARVDLSAPAGELTPMLRLLKTLVMRFGVSCARDWRAGLDHPDEDVRLITLQTATYSDGESAAAQLLTITGAGSIVGVDPLGFDTSALLLKTSDDVLRPLLHRLHPEALVQSYLHRPQLQSEISPRIRAWAEAKLLTPRTSRSFGGSYSYFAQRDEAFAAYVADEHDPMTRLLRTAWEDRAMRDNIRWEHGEGPAWALIKALATREPELVKTIWRECVGDGGSIWVGSIEEFPCDLPAGRLFDDLRAEMLGRANNDERLFTAVRGLERHGHREFLLNWIAASLTGGRALMRARGLTAAGFLVASDDAISFWEGLDADAAPSGWLGEVRSSARSWFSRVQAASHWYRNLRSAASEEEAYRAFWLFNRTSDLRYSLYFQEKPYRVSPASWRAQWLDFFGNAMKTARNDASVTLKHTHVSGATVGNIINGA